MAMYPVSFTFAYKDKNINLSLPIRVKLIKLIQFECPECGPSHNFGISDLKRWLSANAPFDRTKYGQDIWNKVYLGYFPQNILDENQRLPVCPLHMKPTTEKEKCMLKIYTTKKIKHVNIRELLHRYTPWRWSERPSRYGLEVCSFADYNIPEFTAAVEQMIKDLEVRKKKFVTIIITSKPVTKEMLEEAYKISQQKMVEKAI